MRWSAYSRSTFGAIAGTYWIADAPVPTLATRLPVRSTLWSQRAEWNSSPWNVSSPSISGSLGSESPPAPTTSVVDVTVRSPLGGYDVRANTPGGQVVVDGRELRHGPYAAGGQLTEGDGALRVRANAVSGSVVVLRAGHGPADGGTPGNVDEQAAS